MNGFCGYYGLHYTLHGVWRKQWFDRWHGLVLGIAPLCKFCFSGGYFGDCLEKDTLALQDVIITKIWERNESNC